MYVQNLKITQMILTPNYRWKIMAKLQVFKGKTEQCYSIIDTPYESFCAEHRAS